MRGRTLLSIVSMIMALGCGLVQREPDGDRPTGEAGRAGSAPVRPMTQPQPEPQPRPDAGMPQDASSAGSGGAVAKPMLPPNFTLECPGEPASDAPDAPLSAWEEERAAHGQLGLPARFELRGASYRVHGSGVANVRAPFTLRSSSTGTGLVSFTEAEVEGVEGRGRVEFASGGEERGRMPATDGAIEALPLKTVVVESGLLEGTIDVTHERVGGTNYYRASASISDLTLEDIQQGQLYPEGTSGIDGRILWMPSGPVVLREATSLTFYEEGASVEIAASKPLAIDYEAFSVAGDFTSGSLEVDDLEVRGTPVAIFGRAGQLRAGASSVEASERFQLTQAVNEAGLVLPAAVEVVPETAEVWVAPSGTRVVRLHYRERSYSGDAVLGEIRIGGNAKELLELQTGFPPTLTGEIIEAVIDTGWGAPLAAVAALPVVSIVFVFDVFDCIFGGCADLPPPLEPFPQWIDAGGIGTMEVRVKGKLARGTYQTSLTFVGRNYCPVTVPLTVHIGQEPVAADAGAADAGDAGMRDGG